VEAFLVVMVAAILGHAQIDLPAVDILNLIRKGQQRCGCGNQYCSKLLLLLLQKSSQCHCSSKIVKYFTE